MRISITPAFVMALLGFARLNGLTAFAATLVKMLAGDQSGTQ